MRALLPFLITLLLAPPPGVSDELYKWVDERGHTHWTDDLSRIPPRHRRGMEASKFPSAPIVAPLAPASLEPDPEPEEEGLDPGPARHVIPIEKAGLEVHVVALVNGRRAVPFKVDTGAMVNTMPRSWVEELGISVEPAERKIVVVGIGGQPQLVPVIRLRQVDVGGAIVENVDVAVLDTMRVGLLGMPFFRNFRVDLNPVTGLLTLEDVDLSQVEGLYGGYPESYWRTSFRMITAQLEVIREYREVIPEGLAHLHVQLDEAASYWGVEQERLDIEASRAGVPRAWRE